MRQGRDVEATELWITVRGLKDHREWTCPINENIQTTRQDKWRIGDVLLFNALTIAYDDPTISLAPQNGKRLSTSPHFGLDFDTRFQLIK